MTSIYTIKCDCEKADCFIKKKEFKKYINHHRLELSGIETLLKDYKLNTISSVKAYMDLDYDIFNKRTKCDILKSYVQLNEAYMKCMKVNIDNKNEFDTQSIQINRQVTENIKLKLTLSKSINDNLQMRKQIKQLNRN